MYQIKCDAEHPFFEHHLHMGGKNDKGEEINLNSRSLLKNGKPWLPVMGEYHFSRGDRRDWETELMKMKAGGIDIVACYLIWIHFEEEEGNFCFAGDNDIREFVRLCRRHGLYVLMRIGPWAHGEARNGGFPDWLLKKGCKLRDNNDEYLFYARRWYHALYCEVRGELYKDGGNIIGIQLDNELVDNAAHLETLKKIAVDTGFDVPLYTVTGWGRAGGAGIPKWEVLPVFGGYPDGAWVQDKKQAEPSGQYLFYQMRNDETIGADIITAQNLDPEAGICYHLYPYVTCELGGGMYTSHHRRPAIAPDDVGAIALAKLGSGNNLPGYYLYHGAKNPLGKYSTTNESKETGYPNDTPYRNYDFQAPLGEYGQVRDHYHIFKLQHLFLRDFGERLADMYSYLPEGKYPASDLTSLRYAVRAEGDSGFVFVNNYQRHYPLAEHRDVQFQITAPSGREITFPAQGIDIKSGVYFILPFGLELDGGIRLRYATAQLLCKCGNTYFFFAPDGVRSEYLFEKGAASIAADSAQVKNTPEGVLVTGVVPGTEQKITVTAEHGEKIHLITLTYAQALHTYKLDGTVYISGADMYSDNGTVHLYRMGNPDLSYLLYDGEVFRSVKNIAPEKRQEVSYTVSETVTLESEYKKELFLGGERRCVEAVLRLPEETEDMFLKITYTGDVAQLYCNGSLFDDEFYMGRPWEISLKNLGNPAELTLLISELKADDAYLETDKNCGLRIEKIELIPLYKAELVD